MHRCVLLLHHGMRHAASLHLVHLRVLLRHVLPMLRDLHLRHRYLHLHHSIWSRVRWDHRPARSLPRTHHGHVVVQTGGLRLRRHHGTIDGAARHLWPVA